MATVTSDPLVQAVAGLIARHHTGCNQPVTPAPWMTAAADQIATAIIQHTTLDQTRHIALLIELGVTSDA